MLANVQIGVVDAIAAPSMIRIEFSGKGGHGGGMPMKQRCECAALRGAQS
jgi:metal-dependent amidase/aminoacylase/carboxypeptidase family protein